MKKEIAILIVEDSKVLKKIIEKHFDNGSITYINIFPAKKRKEVVKKIEELED